MSKEIVVKAVESIEAVTPEAVVLAPQSIEPTVEVGTVTRSVEAGTVSQVAAARIARQRKALVDVFGEKKVSRTDPIYAAGSVVNDTGVANFKQFRTELENLPTGDMALASTLRRVMNERRGESEADLSLAEVTPSGSIRLNGEEFDLTPTAWEHVLSYSNAPKYASAHAPHASVAVRAAMLNDYLPRESKKVVLAYREVGVDGCALPRPQVYRIASEKYTAFDVDHVMGSLLHSSADLAATWRGQIDYDGSRVKMDFLSMPDHVEDLAAGDVFKVGLRLYANDVREGGINAKVVAWRNRCLNLIVIGELSTALFSQKHVGDARAIYTSLASAFAQAEVAFGEFRHAWGKARSEVVITNELPVDKFMLGLAKSKLVALPAASAESMASTLLQSWMEEPAFDRAAVVNAVTRAAHEGVRWKDAFGAGEVEAQAGRLLTDPNLVKKVQLALA